MQILKDLHGSNMQIFVEVTMQSECNNGFNEV